jgi:hypothetical protein
VATPEQSKATVSTCIRVSGAATTRYAARGNSTELAVAPAASTLALLTQENAAKAARTKYSSGGVHTPALQSFCEQDL